MSYIPNLIPDKHRILKDYFNESAPEPSNSNDPIRVISWVLGIIFFLAAIVFIKHPLLALLFGLIGFIIIPPGHRLVEDKLRFKLTSKLKVGLCSALFIASLPAVSHYNNLDKQLIVQQQLKNEREQNEKAISDQNEQRRKDSLSYYLGLSNQYKKAHQIKDAATQLQFASTFASTPVEKDQIGREEVSIGTVKATDLISAGKYQLALPEISTLLNTDPNNNDLLYNRAICYSKTGHVQEAVNDLKPLIQAGYADAQKIYDKINPIRKKVIGYETLCCDGTSSSAKGRGACSHHGGVCNWNHPIYEEYRKY